MQRLRELRKEKRMSMKDFGLIFGLAESTISQYENGKREPDYGTLKKFADYFNVTTDYLLNRSGLPKDPPNIIPINSSDFYTFSVIGSITAGYTGIAEEVYTGEEIDISLSLFGIKNPKPGNYFVLKIKGDSMYPKLVDGDYVLVERCNHVESGTIAVVLYNSEEATVKKVNYVLGEDWLELIPINPEYKKKRIENSDLELCRVLGKIVGMHRRF